MNFVKVNGKNIYPSKIICIGRNYVEHINELDNEMPTEPVIFLKPNSAIANDIRFNASEAIHYEAEITLLVRAGAIFAVGFGLDLTKRELQTTLKAKGLPWERAKSFDGSAVFSDFVEYKADIHKLSMALYINNEQVQRGNYELMLYKPNELLKEAQSFLTFEDGDLLMTGTPKGVGLITIGDLFTGEIYEGDSILVKKSWVVE